MFLTQYCGMTYGDDTTHHLTCHFTRVHLHLQKYDRLLIEQGEMQNMAKSELATRIHILQSELNQAHLTYESQIKSLKSENERELSQVYSR